MNSWEVSPQIITHSDLIDITYPFPSRDDRIYPSFAFQLLFFCPYLLGWRNVLVNLLHCKILHVRNCRVETGTNGWLRWWIISVGPITDTCAAILFFLVVLVILYLVKLWPSPNFSPREVRKASPLTVEMNSQQFRNQPL